MRTIYRDIVSAIIISKDEKILLGKKDPQKGGVYNDSWHIPGGGIDENEEKLEALIREINEEVGIDITKAAIKLVSSDGNGESIKTLKDTGEKVLCKMNFFVYEVLIYKNSSIIEIKLKDDLIEIKWVSKNDLKNINLNPPSKELFTKLKYL